LNLQLETKSSPTKVLGFYILLTSLVLPSPNWREYDGPGYA